MSGPGERPPVLGGPLLIWAGLIALVFANLGLTFAPIGRYRTPAHFAVSAVMIGLVASFFMQLNRASNLVRLAAFAGVAWASFLFLLSGADVLSR